MYPLQKDKQKWKQKCSTFLEYVLGNNLYVYCILYIQRTFENNGDKGLRFDSIYETHSIL